MSLYRDFRYCHPNRRDRIVILAMILAAASLLTVSPVSLASGLSDEMRDRLEGVVDREGVVAFLATYWLPESHEWFLSALGGHRPRPIDTVQDLQDQLSPQDERAIVANVANGLARLTAAAREGYFQCLDRWVLVYRQLDLMQRFDSLEMVEEAMFSVPATRPIYASIVESRGFDPSIVTPQLISDTMASGEHWETWHRAVTFLSSFSDTQLMEYFRDLYGKLSELTAPESGGVR